MNFILQMAWRDSRASRRRLALVSLSVVLGIAALVGIASLGDNLKRAVEDQTKSLLGSDLTVTSPQALPEATMAYFRTLGGEIALESFCPTFARCHVGRRRDPFGREHARATHAAGCPIAARSVQRVLAGG